MHISRIRSPALTSVHTWRSLLHACTCAITCKPANPHMWAAKAGSSAAQQVEHSSSCRCQFCEAHLTRNFLSKSKLYKVQAALKRRNHLAGKLAVCLPFSGK